MTELFASIGGFAFSAASFIIALSIIVFVHEFGHYIVGRWCGIQAEVFSLGFGPRLASRVDRHGTRWQVAAIPFGGYVKFLGDANAASAGADETAMAGLSDAERRRTMHGAPLWARAATVFAGPLFNFILSFVIFTAVVMVTGTRTEPPQIAAIDRLPGVNELMVGDVILAVNGVETPDYKALADAADRTPPEQSVGYRVRRGDEVLNVAGPQPLPATVVALQPRSAAGDAGIEVGDVILTANGQPTPRFSDLQAIVRAGKTDPVTLLIWRDGKVFDTMMTPRERPVPTKDGGMETGYLIGISGGYWFTPETEMPSLSDAAVIGAGSTWGIIETTVRGVGSMFAGAISTCNINGPIGLAQATSSAASAGIGAFIWMVAAISTAIGFINLLPIPVLDGGHLVFHAWEWAFGRPPPERVMNIAMAAGLSIVIALMIFGVSNDLFCK
ncbi:MAG: RIP metalloprotease RseP [Rhodobacteraceae bacterium]|nr:RIP metalloprotease RseP [Paracoccaceae bacterium]